MVYSRCTTAQALYQTVYTQIRPYVESTPECQAIAKALLEHSCDLSTIDTVLDRSCTLRPKQQAFLAQAVKRLCLYEPLQYILEKAHFLGRSFRVGPGVLIPRPETEEMVEYILADALPENPFILDIGTGSGCIAITLQCAQQNAYTTGVDCSAEALKMARQNGQTLNAKTDWQQCNILTDALPGQKWHIIVSNPPYVLNTQKQAMLPRVLAYEPPKALFVPDENPLLFHRAIALHAMHKLNVGGKLYMEINETLGKEVALMVVGMGFVEVKVKKDVHGKDRWICATHPAIC